MAIDIGLDQAPERGACTSAAEANPGDRDIHFAKEGESVAKAEGNAFQDGANDVGAGVRSGEANQGAASVRIEMRRALANQIGSPQEAVGTGMDFGGFGGELVIGFAGAAGIYCKSVAEPAQREAGCLGDAHDVPAPGNGVAKRVNAAKRIESGAIRGRKNNARSADSSADRPG